MMLRTTRVAAMVGVVAGLACASPAGYRLETYVPSLRVSVSEVVEESLTDLGYDVTSVMPRASSTTFSAVKIRPGTEDGGLIYDWLHVTVTVARLVTEPVPAEGATGDYVEVRAESVLHGREKRPIPPTPGVIADAEAFVAMLPTAQRLVPN